MDELDKIAFDAARNLSNFRFKELEDNKLRVWERLDTMSTQIAERMDTMSAQIAKNRQDAAHANQMIDSRIIGKMNQILVSVIVAAVSVIVSFYVMHVTVPVK